jgi:hypothetical protein
MVEFSKNWEAIQRQEAPNQNLNSFTRARAEDRVKNQNPNN